MQSFLKKNILFIFGMIATAEIITRLFPGNQADYFLKPLLLPLLMIAVLVYTKASTPRSIILTGLFFSFAGDTLLLFEEKNALFFIGGLICFLITHLLYCWYFLKAAAKAVSYLKNKPLVILTVLVYTTGLLFLLFPSLGDLKIPVLLYATVLSLMLLCSIHAINHFKIAWHFVTGALFFVISDSLLAINKFYAPFSYAGFFIMLTYCLAQFLIVKGYIKNNE